ncbi:DUF4436 family protein [Microbacterium sp. P03]|uniref:DUF4436 family protein n=1 Tax=Microbacterium sp. P03 TaxID=3366946 RepID=UPI003744D5B2
MSSSRADDPPRGRRAPWLVIGLVAGFVVLYVAVVLLYAVTSRPATDGLPSEVPDDGIGLTLQPQSVSAAGNRFAMTIDLTSPGPLDDGDGRLSEPVTLVVTENDGPRLFEFPAHTLTSSVSVDLVTHGYVELWPFDRYSVVTTIVAGAGTGDDIEAVNAYLAGRGGVPGWSIQIEPEKRGATATVNGIDTPVDSLVITASRSGATIVFGIVLLSLMVAMAVLVLVVTVTVLRGRRKVEPSLMSWTAAMLFATIPLRNFLPGSPPIGSWIDFIVVLWVIAGLVAGLVIYVVAWLRWSPRLRAGKDDADAAVIVAPAAAGDAANRDAAAADT